MVLKGTHAVSCLARRPLSDVGGTLETTTALSLLQIERHYVSLETTTISKLAWEGCYLQFCGIPDVILDAECYQN